MEVLLRQYSDSCFSMFHFNNFVSFVFVLDSRLSSMRDDLQKTANSSSLHLYKPSNDFLLVFPLTLRFMSLVFMSKYWNE